MSALALAMGAGVASYLGARSIDPVALGWDTGNCWFKADLFRVYGNMISVFSNHSRTNVHPLFSLIAFPPVRLLQTVFGLGALTAVRVVVAGVAAVWSMALFALLRLIGCHRFDAALFTLLGMTSAAAVFWFVVPETYSFGSLTIVAALLFVTLTQQRRFTPAWHIVMSALTASITVTNWMAGMLATMVNHRWRRSLLITGAAFCLVLCLWTAQKLIFRSSAIPLLAHSETKYVLTAGSGGPWHVLRSALAHTMVMPAIAVVDRESPGIMVSDRLGQPAWPVMLTQASAPGSAGAWGAVGMVVWVVLLGGGVYGLLTIRRQPKLRLVLALTLAGQLLLHVFYGDETFLYSLHFAPLLVVLAALGTLTAARPWALLLAGMLTVCAAVNNGRELNRAREFYVRFGAPRNHGGREALTQMQQRPADPWPRGRGHIVLGHPGSPDTSKAYHEPGGDFSPAVGSFGVSFWVVDTHGAIRTTSSTLPVELVDQQFVYDEARTVPSVLTSTPCYEALWSMRKTGGWQLELKPTIGLRAREDRLSVVVRSVGPAGGPVHSLSWDKHRLIINDRWRLTFEGKVIGVHLGEEGAPGWLTERSA
ncbi:MAG: hypothetical protein GF331_23960, partial [Chitinivibrionales bacterium]|nr:hypothetical protein [Chitinivibrionales bacterium]